MASKPLALLADSDRCRLPWRRRVPHLLPPRVRASSESLDSWLQVEDPRLPLHPATDAWEVARRGLHFCNWKARMDVRTIRILHDKVVNVLNPLVRDRKLIDSLKQELDNLQGDIVRGHEQVHMSETRVSQALADMEQLVIDEKLLHCNMSAEHQVVQSDSISIVGSSMRHREMGIRSKYLNVAGPAQPYSSSLQNFWYPVAFSADIKSDTMVPFECFEEPWVLFRGEGEEGKIGCVQNSCAHRACPLDLGKVTEGRIQCPYHGWEYSINGLCEKMPSTRPMQVSIRSLPCVEQDGLVWIWPGSGIPEAVVPSLSPPDSFTIHAQIVMDLPVEHGLLMENLLDLAHAPFTHTTTFAKGWPVPSLVKFCTPVKSLEGYWDPYPIDMEFQPPCMVRSVIGISKPGTLDGKSVASCSKHLHQLHVCLPSTRGKTRLLYRMSLDFYPFLRHVPYIDYLWRYLAKKVLDEDLRLVLGQQERMEQGYNIWNMPVAYDKLGVRYRKWRLAIEDGEMPRCI